MSKVAGNLDGFGHCGDRSFSITTTPTSYYEKVLSLDSSTNILTLGVAATGLTDVKTYTIVVKMWLVNYATVSTTATFTASVTNCVVTGLSTTAVASQSYNIYTPQIQFTFVEFV